MFDVTNRKLGNRKRGARPRAPSANSPDTTSNSHTSPRSIERAERIAETLNLRKQGYSYPAIAAEMGVSMSTAHDYVLAGMLAIIREPAEHCRLLELERLDLMLKGIFPAAVGGDINAIGVVLQIQARRARLLGLDKTAEIPGFAQLAGAQSHIRISFVGPDGEVEATERGLLQ